MERQSNYVLGVVLFAVALFLARVSTKLESRGRRRGLLTFGYVVFVGTVAWIARSRSAWRSEAAPPGAGRLRWGLSHADSHPERARNSLRKCCAHGTSALEPRVGHSVATRTTRVRAAVNGSSARQKAC